MRQFEALLFSVDPFGYYQKSRIVILSLILGFFSSNGVSLTTLLTFTPSHRCNVNATGSDLDDFLPVVTYHEETRHDPCRMFDINGEPAFSGNVTLTKPCTHGFEYVGGGAGTISSEFNLVCGDAVYKSVILGLQLFLLNFGIIIYGFISDKIGRKKAILIICLVWSITTSIAAFVHTFSIFVPLWLLGTISGATVYMVPNVLGNELVDNSHRPLVNGVLDFSCSLFSAGLAGLCYLIGRWRVTAKIMGFLGLVLTSFVLILDESPRWLLTQGRTEEALVIIRKIGRINGRELTSKDMHDNLDHSKSFVGMMETRPEKNGLLRIITDLVTRTHLRRKMIISFFIIFAPLGVHYGVPMALQLLKVNPYLLHATQSLAATVPVLLAPTVVKHTGRIKAYFLFAVLCGVSCTMIGFVPPVAAAICAILARALSSGICVVFLAISSEILPTQVRSSGYSVVRIATAITSTGWPFLYLYLGDELGLRWLGFASVGGCVMLCAILAFYLPETARVPLTDTVEESEVQLPVKWSNFSSNALWFRKRGGTMEKDIPTRIQ